MRNDVGIDDGPPGSSGHVDDGDLAARGVFEELPRRQSGGPR